MHLKLFYLKKCHECDSTQKRFEIWRIWYHRNKIWSLFPFNHCKKIFEKNTVRIIFWVSGEASSHDQIKMTKLWLENDQNNFTPTNINIGTWTKNWQWQINKQLNMTKKYMVMFTNFGLIHSVILIRSSEYSSFRVDTFVNVALMTSFSIDNYKVLLLIYIKKIYSKNILSGSQKCNWSLYTH